MIVLNIVRNGSLCSSIAFEKEVFSHQNDTRLLARNPLFLSGSTDKFVQQGCFFLPSFSCNFDDQFSSNFHRLVILCFNMYGLMLGVGGGGQSGLAPPRPPPPLLPKCTCCGYGFTPSIFSSLCGWNLRFILIGF